MRTFLVGVACLVALGAAPPPADTAKILKGIEAHYNSMQTLSIRFTETVAFQKRRRSESGTLTLRKPGKMRWEYSQPAGKLFISDGKFIWYYSPEENRAEKMRFREVEDLRAPLAFLLGKLDFTRDFGEFRTSGGTITAVPKSDKLPYAEVSFEPGPDSSIRHLSIRGQDGSLTEFVFEDERRGVAADESLFRFTPPSGVEFVDSSRQ